MQPRRPDSAKTQFTKQTIDSQNSKRDLNSSKFSETFSSGVTSFHEKPDEFKQYVAEKDKDPRFKNLKSKLEVIEQKAKKKQESKPNDKPFLRKKERTIQKTSKKVEEKEEKQEDQLNLSRGFAEKSKIKMNSLKIASQQKQQEEEKGKEKLKSRINFDSFKVTKPGEKKQPKKEMTVSLKKQNSNKEVKKQAKIEEKKEQISNGKSKSKNEEQQERENELRSLQRYVSELEARNMQIFPRSYDRMVSQNLNNIEDLQKIDINNFLDDPTQQDFELLKLKIEDFDKKLESEKYEQSIDLEEIIGDTTQEKEIEKQQQQSQNESYLQSMSASELKKRNAFLTQVLAGKISKKQIDQLEEMNRSSMRMHKIDHEKEEEEEDDLQNSDINMMKRKSNRLMERNRLEAAGQLYRDCDYLSEEHQKRLEQLMNGQFGDFPFEVDQLEKIRRRNIDQGIRMYRQLNGSEELPDVLDDESLPKDPELRREAEKKVLREKVKSVNERLRDVDKITVTKSKIQSLLKQFENSKRSASYNELNLQNQKKYQQNMKKLQEAQILLKKLQEKQNIDEIIGDIEQQYQELEKEIKRWSEIDEEQLRQMEKERLQRKLKEVEELEKENINIDNEIDQIEKIKKEVEEKLKLYDEIQIVALDNIECQGYNKDETLQDIDSMITAKWQMAQKDPSEAETES